LGFEERASLSKGRLEAFSDGVIAIIITIMVLELKVPHTADWSEVASRTPVFLSYVLSFVFLGIYWNNHHHMLHMADHVTGGILWANLHLLFWLSLVPFVTGWLGENQAAALPTAMYGVVMLAAAIAYIVLQATIIAAQGPHSRLRAAVGSDRKGKLSIALYSAAILLAFVNRWIAIGIYIAVALMWLVPDRRIESQLKQNH
jgi:TMEM175 potassium channel family protein